MLSFSSVIPAREDKNLPRPTWPSPPYSRPTFPRTPNLSAMPKCNRRATSVPVENSSKTRGDGCLRCQSGTGQNVTCDRSGFSKSQTLESNPDSLLVWSRPRIPAHDAYARADTDWPQRVYRGRAYFCGHSFSLSFDHTRFIKSQVLASHLTMSRAKLSLIPHE